MVLPRQDDDRQDDAQHGILERLERRMGKDVDRIAFFSDAVFAIAITLLSVRIEIPSGTRDVSSALAHAWPQYFAFALSFWVIGSFWIAHHRLFRFVSRYDGALLRVNLLLLAAIAFLPFPTEVVGRWGDQRAAVVLYAGTIAACSVAMSLVWWVALRRGLLEPGLPPALAPTFAWRSIWLSAPFLVSIPVALVSPRAAILIWLLFAAVRPIERRVLRRRLGELARHL